MPTLKEEVNLQDEPDWHKADSEQYESEGEGELYEFGQECLDRISLALGGKTMVPMAAQALPQLMTDQRWEQRHAALICLAQIAEGCAKVMLQTKQISGLVQMCKQVSKRHLHATAIALRHICTSPLPAVDAGVSLVPCRRECSTGIASKQAALAK